MASEGIEKLIRPELVTLTSRLFVIKRETEETNISLEINIDGSGKWDITTGIKMFDFDIPK